MDVILGDRPGPLGPDELTGRYPWPQAGRWVRVVMVRSLDGAVSGPDGRSRSISSDADRAVLAALRRLSDVTLVGASTVRVEPYGPVRVDEPTRAERVAAGLAPAPLIAVVSGTLDLPWSEPMFHEGDARVLVVTSGSVGAEALRTARRNADVVQLSRDPLDPRELVEVLEGRGLRRIVCEGGPTLVRSLAAGRLVDEVDLSLSPVLADRAGGSPSDRGADPLQPGRFDLVQVICDDGFLFTRFVARRSEGGPPPDRLGSEQ